MVDRSCAICLVGRIVFVAEYVLLFLQSEVWITDLTEALPHRLFQVFQLLKLDQDACQVSMLHLPPMSSIFSTKHPWQPSVFMTTVFPHLRVKPLSSLLHFRIPHVDSPRSAPAYLRYLHDTFSWHMAKCTAILYHPIRLVREECHMKRRENEKIRNERAEVLGKLVGLRPSLCRLLETRGGEEHSSASHAVLLEFVSTLDPTILSTAGENDVLSLLERLFHTVFVAQEELHSSCLNKDGLQRPSRLTLLWPKLLFLPPLTLYCVKTLYASRETIIDLARDSLEASRKFARDWLLEPLRGVYRTIRTGGEEAVLVRPESVAADLDVGCVHVLKPLV